MARNDELERLREEARRQRANATAKARRLRGQGINVAGSGNDPRRVAGVEKSYNSKQLRNYIKQLSTFNLRSTQFVAGAAGRAIGKMVFSQLQSAARMANIRAERRMARVQNVNMPGSDETYLSARKATKHSRGLSPASTYDKVDVRPGEIRDEAAARALTRNINRKTSPAGVRRANAVGARNVNKMLSESASPFLGARWDELTHDQQELLLNTPQFWESAKFLRYEELQNGESSEESGEISSFFAFAKRTLPESE